MMDSKVLTINRVSHLGMCLVLAVLTACTLQPQPTSSCIMPRVRSRGLEIPSNGIRREVEIAYETASGRCQYVFPISVMAVTQDGFTYKENSVSDAGTLYDWHVLFVRKPADDGTHFQLSYQNPISLPLLATAGMWIVRTISPTIDFAATLPVTPVMSSSGQQMASMHADYFTINHFETLSPSATLTDVIDSAGGITKLQDSEMLLERTASSGPVYLLVTIDPLKKIRQYTSPIGDPGPADPEALFNANCAPYPHKYWGWRCWDWLSQIRRIHAQ